MNRTNYSKRFASVPVFLAFLCMGFGDVVGPLVGLVEDTFRLTNFHAQLISLSGFIMFGVLSIPMGILQDRKGKKFIMNLGLIVAFIGLIVPILNDMHGQIHVGEDASMDKFIILLIAILLLGAGATILQVVGNPIMRDVSPEGQYSSNLSFAQSVKAIGSSLGFLLPPFVIKFFNLDWSILFPVYSVLILITLFWFNAAGYKEPETVQRKTSSLRSSFSLLKDPYVLMMVLGIFLYVGAEVSMSTEVPILLKKKFGYLDFGLWIAWALFFLPILIGRFTGGVILRYLKPKLFLRITVVISIIGLIMIFLNNPVITFVSIVLVGLGFANIFPLIFSIAVDKMPERTNELSGLMVTAIVGGALLPPVMGKLADITSITTAFIVPLIALIYILFVSININK